MLFPEDPLDSVDTAALIQGLSGGEGSGVAAADGAQPPSVAAGEQTSARLRSEQVRAMSALAGDERLSYLSNALRLNQFLHEAFDRLAPVEVKERLAGNWEIDYSTPVQHGKNLGLREPQVKQLAALQGEARMEAWGVMLRIKLFVLWMRRDPRALAARRSTKIDKLFQLGGEEGGAAGQERRARQIAKMQANWKRGKIRKGGA